MPSGFGNPRTILKLRSALYIDLYHISVLFYSFIHHTIQVHFWNRFQPYVSFQKKVLRSILGWGGFCRNPCWHLFIISLWTSFEASLPPGTVTHWKRVGYKNKPKVTTFVLNYFTSHDGSWTFMFNRNSTILPAHRLWRGGTFEPVETAQLDGHGAQFYPAHSQIISGCCDRAHPDEELGDYPNLPASALRNGPGGLTEQARSYGMSHFQ